MRRKAVITGSVIFSLTICLVLAVHLYKTYKPGYVYENGIWNYVSYDTGVGRRVNPIHVRKDELKVLKYKDFARDNKSVYFKSNKVEGSDPETFQIISGKGRYRYAKDKNNVYIYARDDWSLYKLLHADPISFEIMAFPYSKDKNDAYCGNLPLYVDDVSKFKVTESTGFAIMSSVYGFLGTASDPADSSSEYERNRHAYNRKKYGFITDPVFYSEDGKAKTDQLTYSGYRLDGG
ncbi:DKNYY domain-containing protein [Paenibacillus sp. R14(2021)]|uniref:DKNYY domain-containing protein n=1 Tax=Paenibacillus sp. R14(2021) TaxID=2859228 RepID=UPI001C61143A|nr:DKNYY domain-containing protein [Paenibacillus sp. R14(2021)]